MQSDCVPPHPTALRAGANLERAGSHREGASRLVIMARVPKSMVNEFYQKMNAPLDQIRYECVPCGSTPAQAGYRCTAITPGFTKGLTPVPPLKAEAFGKGKREAEHAAAADLLAQLHARNVLDIGTWGEFQHYRAAQQQQGAAAAPLAPPSSAAAAGAAMFQVRSSLQQPDCRLKR